MLGWVVVRWVGVPWCWVRLARNTRAVAVGDAEPTERSCTVPPVGNAGGPQTGHRNPVKSLWNSIRSRPVRDNIIAGLILAAVLSVIPFAWAYLPGQDDSATPAPMRLVVNCEVPPRIRPGELIGLIYNIDAPVAVDVGLGAALYDEQGTDHSTGTGDVDALQLPAGSQRLTRQFIVPTGLQPGFYELTAEVWPANKIGSEDVETLAAGPCAIVTIP